MRRTWAFVAAVLILTQAAYSAATRSSAHPNVVFITVDTLRADHLGCYGADQVETPTIDGLARDGVMFGRALSQVPLTWPSHAAMLTGTYPFQNGVQDFTGHPLSKQFRSVAQAFQQAGYTTGAVVSSFVLDRSWGLARGFDYYDDAFSAQTFKETDIGLVDRKAGESVDHAIAWLKRTPKRPFFLWLHLYDPHSPYDPPQPYQSEYKTHPYDGEIAYVDHELGRLISWLRANQLYSSSVILFASDHGESLGEHGESEHGFFVYHSTTHIPLIVKPAVARAQKGIHRDGPVESIAIAPTLLHLAGIKDVIEQQFSGRGLLDGSDEGESLAYSETFYPFSSFGWSPLHGLESGRYHYIDAPTPELYDVAADPGEQKNLAGEQPATVTVLKQKLQQLLTRKPFAAPAGESESLSPEAQEKLQALGYVAYRSPVSPEVLAKGLADPKDKLHEYNSFLQAADALRQGNFELGGELLSKLEKDEPQIYAIPFMLGEAALRQKKWAEGASLMKRALSLNPGFDEAMMGLAHALYAQGDVEQAASWLEKALQNNSRNYRAWYELATIVAKRDPAKAQTAYQTAIAVQPDFAPAQRDFGVFEAGRKQYREALQHFIHARELGAGDAEMFNFMGICYSQTGQPQKAIESLRRAIAMDPMLAEAHLNLGYAYERQHSKAAADEYAEACKLASRFCGLRPK